MTSTACHWQMPTTLNGSPHWSERMCASSTPPSRGSRPLAASASRLHVMVYCLRSDAIRVISLRKANAREVKRYAELKPGTTCPRRKRTRPFWLAWPLTRQTPNGRRRTLPRLKPASEALPPALYAALVAKRPRGAPRPMPPRCSPPFDWMPTCCKPQGHRQRLADLCECGVAPVHRRASHQLESRTGLLSTCPRRCTQCCG